MVKLMKVSHHRYFFKDMTTFKIFQVVTNFKKYPNRLPGLLCRTKEENLGVLIKAYRVCFFSPSA